MLASTKTTSFPKCLIGNPLTQILCFLGERSLCDLGGSIFLVVNG